MDRLHQRQHGHLHGGAKRQYNRDRQLCDGEPNNYVLTVNSTNPASGVAITVSPADNNSASNGTTAFTRTYNSGHPSR